MKLIALFFSVFLTAVLAWANLDLNTASSKDLENLPGIGKKGAEDIIAARPFQSVEDLKKVKGIGAGKFAKIQPLVQVGSTPAASTSPAAAPAPTPKSPAVTASAPAPAPAKPQDSAATPRAPVMAATAPAATTAAAPAHTSGSSTKAAPGTVININSATLAQLEALPGIGPVKAQAIIQNRPFASVEDLKKVKGIKEGTLAKIRPFVSVQ